MNYSTSVATPLTDGSSGWLKPETSEPSRIPHPATVTDWAKFREFVLAHGDKSQAEMAELWVVLRKLVENKKLRGCGN